MLKNALGILLLALCFGSSVHAQEREESMVMSASDSFRKKWNMTFFSIASVSNMSFGKKNTAARSFGSYNYLGLNHRLNQDEKVSLRVPFLFNSSGQNEYADHVQQEVKLHDVHVAYSMYDLGYIGDVDISGNVKLYLPTSQFSQNQEMIAKLRLEAYFEYAIGRFSSITWAVKPDIFWQSRTAYLNEDTPVWEDGEFKKDPRSTNKRYSLEHFVEVVVDINRYFALKPKVGFDEDWYYSSEAEKLEGGHVTKLKAGLGLEIRPVRGLTFTVGMQNSTTLNSYRGKDVAYFQPENTEYSLMTNALVF